MKYLLFPMLISLLYSSPHSQVFNEKQESMEDLRQEIASVLKQPHERAKKKMVSLGPLAQESLKAMIFDDQVPMGTRWKSFMVYTGVKGVKSMSVIERALEHKTWFLRSASLTALEQMDESLAKKWAFEKLKRDPALLVRTKALEILQKNPDARAKELFWKKLHSADSFYNGRSLWIRYHLAHTLLENLRKGDTQRWVRLLHGPDSKLQSMAALALSRIRNQIQTSKDVSYWKAQYPQSRNL